MVELLIFDFVWYMGWVWCWYHLEGEGREKWARTILYLRTYQASSRTVMSFMLVYYYQALWARAKDMFDCIPWPDTPFFVIHAVVGSLADDGHLARETMFRYVLASTFMCFHEASIKFRDVYPDRDQALVELALLTEAEAADIRKRRASVPYNSDLLFIPLLWATRYAATAYEDGEIYPRVNEPAVRDRDPTVVNVMVQDVLQSLRDYRTQCAKLVFAVYLPFPLMLQQLVTITVYLYLYSSVISQQEVPGDSRL